MSRDFSKYKNLETAVIGFSEWSGAAWIYLDCKDNEVITRVHTPVTWESDFIITVHQKGDLYDRNLKIGKEKLYDILEKIKEKVSKGWTKEEILFYGYDYEE